MEEFTLTFAERYRGNTRRAGPHREGMLSPAAVEQRETRSRERPGLRVLYWSLSFAGPLIIG